MNSLAVRKQHDPQVSSNPISVAPEPDSTIRLNLTAMGPLDDPPDLYRIEIIPSG